MSLGVRKINLLGVAAVALLAVSTSGCSSLPSAPDWVDPTTWFSGDDSSADAGQTPDLASLPDKPATETADEKQKVTESLAADRANAKYSADALRGGTEPAATPPADVAPASVADNDTPTVSAAKSASPARVVAEAVRPTVDRSISQDPAGSTSAGTLPAPRPGTAVAAVPPPAEAVKTAELTPPAESPVKPVKRVKPARVATAAEASPPAVPHSARRSAPPGEQQITRPSAPPVAYQPVASVSPSDAELGFKPSSAPPLDPTVSQFVAAPIVDHYRRTAATAGLAGSAAPSRVASAPPLRRAAHHRAKAVAIGGPEHMEGKVVANLDAIGSSPAVAQTGVSANGSATAVVYFPNDSVGLTGDGRAQIRTAVEQYNATGGQGYVRVVGHSSSRTPNMSAERHLELIFKKSQDRANAVARELIRAGIPADHVLVEAVGDTQPVYYESMPKGEDGNRRAEIFVEG